MTIMPSMTEFNQRPIANHETLGDRLRRTREQQRLTLAQAAAALHIRRDYLEAIEHSQYRALPSSVFVKHYIRNYARYLGLGKQTTEALLQAELRVYEPKPAIPTLKRYLTKQPLKLAQVVMVVLIIFAILAVGTYLSFEISNIVEPPALQLDQLPSQVTAEQRFVTITGRTTPEATILINDQAIPVSVDGVFSQVVTLHTGSNVFKIVAKTKRSRERVLYQQIIVSEN